MGNDCLKERFYETLASPIKEKLPRAPRSQDREARLLVPQSGVGAVGVLTAGWAQRVGGSRGSGDEPSACGAGGAGATADLSLPFCVPGSHLHSNSTATLTAAISDTSYSSAGPIELLFSSNNQISSPPESSGYSEELCTFLWPIQSANQPGKDARASKRRA